ncbi:alpha/beta fold hydrolase [Chishuiella sp.]|uniref:alpha/beta fold hydrolase n=1 Tax=Chishuiella sp. TaxID=1969467 RepID=UPI0028A9F4EF|nr:alpha/beta fold hydrolase [Chishuiella sp.]
MQNLKQLQVPIWPLEDNTIISKVSVTYQVFGQPLGTAPVILINHSLLGDSDSAYHWDGVMGKNKAIDLNEYTVITIDIPGNEVSKVINYDYLPFDRITARDVAVLFWLTLFELEINEVFAIIGADLGGGIAWEMACLFPNKVLNIIPIASSPKTQDWIIEEPVAKNEYLKSLFYSIDISRHRTDILEITQYIKSKIHVIYVKEEHLFNRAKLRKFYTKLNNNKNSVKFYEIEQIQNNKLLKEHIDQVEKIVDQILEEEYINNVA